MTPNAPVLIRDATLNDATSMAIVHAACFDRAWSQADMQTHLEAGPTIAFVAALRHSTDIAGFALARLVAQEAEILSIAVRPELRRSGIAATLLTRIETEIGLRGGGDLFLEVAADNEAAIALYGAAGLRAGGRRVGYYTRSASPAVDAIVLTKRISPWPSER